MFSYGVPRDPDAGVVLRAAAGRHSGRHDAGDLRPGVRLSRLRIAAVQSVAAPHLRRRHQRHAARHPALRLHGHDAGAVAAGGRPDGRDRPRRRRAARRPWHRHRAGRRADGRHHRHRRRHGGDARPADAARHAAARLRQGPRLRRDLRLRHARTDHPAEPDPYSAGRHPERVGRHAVRRRDDPGPDAGRHLLHLHPGPRDCPPGHGARHPAGRARAGFQGRARDAHRESGRAAGRPGRRGARLHHRRHRRAVGGRLHGRARLDRDHRHHRAHVVAGACARPARPR